MYSTINCFTYYIYNEYHMPLCQSALYKSYFAYIVIVLSHIEENSNTDRLDYSNVNILCHIMKFLL